MTKILFLAFAAFSALLIPQLAAAGTLDPLNGNSWTLYVFGNGDAVFTILTSIKLLMVPDDGGTGFNSLMMFLATLGFLVLAIQAGFDPGKNLIKMFSYIVVVAGVHITTMQVTANIAVVDPVTNYSNVAPGVPALVGVPAALVSDVGHWFTRTIETYYAIPGPLTMSGGGGFNMFGRMMQESNDMVISNPDLKKSLAAFTADCTIPAMAAGRMTASDLINSPVLMDTLALAKHEAILTKYWPTWVSPDGGGPPAYSGTASCAAEGSPGRVCLPYGGETWEVQGGLGAVLPCSGAYQFLKADMTKHADDLLKASAKQWAKTGVMVPFEAAQSAAMALASNGGANAFANYSRPQGYILQQAFINGMSGAFRSAAASTGNNEIMMASAVSQAEASQKSSWSTAARVFTNMMGYVYTTLQAFIFAIVPIVIIALMVPGLGRAMFVNYAQILIWLMLWQPMLSIVNFLITLFGKAQIGGVMDIAGGVTMGNKWALSEATNDLMLAAQFLGTSVPLLTWGLVKGSMAFTEFISHGIGSSMAQQAGATAATGNMSLGNMSMDNTSMNKFNTAMSSAVGAQTTMGYTGGATDSSDAAGHVAAQHGSALTTSASVSSTQAKQASVNKAIQSSESASKSFNAQTTEGLEQRQGLDNTKAMQTTAAGVTQLGTTWSESMKSGNSEKAGESATAGKEATLAMVKSAQATLKAGGSIDMKVGGAIGKAVDVVTGMSAKGSIGADFSASKLQNKGEAEKVLNQLATDLSTSLGSDSAKGTSGGFTQTSGRSTSAGTTTSNSKSSSLQESRSVADLMQSAQQRSESISYGLTNTQVQGVTTSSPLPYQDSNTAALARVGSDTPGAVGSELGAAQKSVGGPGVTVSNDSVSAGRATAQAAFDSGPHTKNRLKNSAPTSGAPGSVGGVGGGLDALKGRVADNRTGAETKIGAGRGTVAAANKKIADTTVADKVLSGLPGLPTLPSVSKLPGLPTLPSGMPEGPLL